MDPATRVVVNTSAQYVKTIINVLLSMYSTRLILALLGSSDYGIYSLVAGVVAMLSFVSNALVVSTQRFLSFYQGKGDAGKLKNIFNDSEVLHLALGVLITVVLLAVTPLLFNGFLEIPAERLPTARSLYALVVAALFVTLVTAPFKALLISHEDIVFVSVIDVLDGVLKVVLVLGLAGLSVDKLLGYGWLLLFIQMFNFGAYAGVAFARFEECVVPRVSRVSKSSIKEMSSFAGWTVYSTGCVLGRTQGVAILLNKFFGLVANAGLGIAQQVSAFVSFVSDAVLVALRPQITKAEGAGNRDLMLKLSSEASKTAVVLLSALVIPVSIYMQPLLTFWLGDVPDNAAFFCRMVIFCSLADSITTGLNIANQAVGRIKEYSLVVNTTKFMTVPIMLVMLLCGTSLMGVAICYVGMELLCALIRLPFLKVTAGLKIKSYLTDILAPVLLPILLYAAILLLFKQVMDIGFIIAFVISGLLFAVLIYFLALDKEEKAFIRQLACRIFNRG